MRIASYNIRKARGLDQRHDPHRVIAVINALEADIIVLQEADHRLGDRPAALPRWLVESETDFDVAPVTGDERSLGWHGNAVLVRRGVALEAPRCIDLPGLEPRGAVFFGLKGARRVHVTATHLGLLRRHRRQQLAAIAGEIAGAEHSVVLGDFNEWSKTRGLEALAERHTVIAPGRTFHAARPLAALDRIAHTPGIGIRDVGVFNTRLSRRASDHLPVWADLDLGPA